MRNISTRHKALLSLLFLLVILLLVAFFTYHLNSKKTEVFVESNVRQLEHSVHQVLTLNAMGVKQGVTDYTYWDDMVTAIESKDSIWYKENIDEMIVTYHLESAWVFDNHGNGVYSAAMPTFSWLTQVTIPKIVFDSLSVKRFYNTIIKTNSGYIELVGATVHHSNDPQRLSSPLGFYIVGRFMGKPFISNLSKILGSRVVLTNDKQPTGLVRRDEAIAVMIPLAIVGETTPLYLYVEKNVPFLKQYAQFSSELLWLLMGAAITIMLGAWFTFSSWVTQPLNMVSKFLATNDSKAGEKLSGFGYEFQEIGGLIKQSVEQKTQLEFLRRKAEESDKLKSSFLANMSHEIRTPLNGILGFSELICRRMTTDETSANYTKVIKGCSDDLLQIINDLLDISKLEADQMTMLMEKVSCTELLGELQIQYKHSASINKEGVELIFESSGCSAMVNADRHRLKQVLVNLLNNALKFTEAGKIEVGCYIEEVGFAVFYVKDSGIGIPESQQGLIFERFRQSDSNFTISRQYGGVGLGLSICKGLVDKMRGEISLCSVLGKGSTFFVRIPLVAVSQ